MLSSESVDSRSQMTELPCLDYEVSLKGRDNSTNLCMQLLICSYCTSFQCILDATCPR